MPESSTRVHGFQRPFDNHQLASWVALIIFLVLFYTLYLPLHTDAAGIVLGALYTATAAIVTYSAWKAMIIDPSDPSVAAKRLNSIAASSSAEGADTMWCYLCKVSVSRRSKHCRRCNKCVDVFDHHCPWLNTCIGAQNYRLFLVLLGSVFVLTCLQMGTAVHAAVAPYLEPAELARLRETYPHLPEAALAALLAVSCLLALVTWLLITQLLLFHAGLLCRGLTTYEFIIAQRQKEKAEAAADEKRKPTRRTLFVRELQKQMPCLQMCRLCSEVERVDRKPAAPPKSASSSSSAAASSSSLGGSSGGGAAGAKPGIVVSVSGRGSGKGKWGRRGSKDAASVSPDDSRPATADASEEVPRDAGQPAPSDGPPAPSDAPSDGSSSAQSSRPSSGLPRAPAPAPAQPSPLAVAAADGDAAADDAEAPTPVVPADITPDRPRPASRRDIHLEPADRYQVQSVEEGSP